MVFGWDILTFPTPLDARTFMFLEPLVPCPVPLQHYATLTTKHYRIDCYHKFMTDLGEIPPPKKTDFKGLQKP